VRVRTVDQRHVAVGDGRVEGVDDPDGLRRSATRLEADLAVLRGGAGNADAQAAAHAEGRVLELERRVVRVAVAVRPRRGGRQAEASAVVQLNRGRHEAGPEEVGGQALERRVDVFRGVRVAGAEQDDRFFFQAEDGIRDKLVTGVQTCALPI